jgi:formiminotetrahydrofolate cyclodeaminase
LRVRRDPLDLPVRDLLEELAAADSPLPGSGAAAALTTGMAAALLQMVARRSAKDWAEGRAVAAQAETLRLRTMPLPQAVTIAYGDVLELLAEPDLAQAEGRDEALGLALGRAADLPLKIAEIACDVAELGLLVAERCEPMLRPDAISAVLLAEGAAQVGAHLVSVNLATRPEDERAASATELAEAATRAARRALAAIAE